MEKSFTIYYGFIITSLIFTICSSVLIQTNEHLHLEHQQQELDTKERHQQNFQIQSLQQKVKYIPLQRDSLVQKSKDIKSLQSNDTFVSRTFGYRPLKLALPAIMYKLGVITTMLGVLTILSAKGLIVGLIILITQLSAGFAKFALLKNNHENWDQEHSPHGKPPQNIHVHVHGIGSGGHYKTSYSHSPYSGWSKTDLLSATNRVDDDYYHRLKELKQLQQLRESLYTQVI